MFLFSNSQYQYPISGTDFYNDPMKFINCSTPTIFLVGGYTSDMGQDPLYVATKSGIKRILDEKRDLSKSAQIFQIQKRI